MSSSSYFQLKMSTASTTWASAAIQIVAATRGTSNQSVATTTSCTSADATPGAKRRVLIGLPFNFGHSRCLKSSHHWSLKIKIHLNTVWFEFPAQHTICCWSTSFVRKYILRCSALGFKIALQEFLEMIEYRHSSVDFFCAYHPAAPGLSPKHTLYAIII